jgi:predicted transcriptional regulator
MFICTSKNLKRGFNMAKKSVTIAAEITPDQKDFLNYLSKEMDRSVSWIIRDAINNYKVKSSSTIKEEN